MKSRTTVRLADEAMIETDQQVLPEAFLPLFSNAQSLRRLAQDFQPGRRTTIMTKDTSNCLEKVKKIIHLNLTN